MKFTTIKNVVDRKAATLLKALCSITIVYTNNFFIIKTLYMDNRFEVLRETLQDKGITLNTTVFGKQIPKIERKIKVVE